MSSAKSRPDLWTLASVTIAGIALNMQINDIAADYNASINELTKTVAHLDKTIEVSKAISENKFSVIEKNSAAILKIAKTVNQHFKEDHNEQIN